MTEAENTAPKKRRVGRWLLIIAIVAFVLIAAAPTVLSLGPATSIARNAMAASIQGDVSIGGVSLGWLSGQRIQGLSIKDASGANSLDADVVVNRGLLSLLLSGGGSIDATVSATVKSTIEADRSLGLAKLFASSDKKSPQDVAPPPASPKSSGLPSVHLTIERLALTLRDDQQRVYALDGLSGSVDVNGGAGTVEANLAGNTDFLGGKGTLALKASASGLQAPLDLGRIAGDVTFDGKNIRVPVDTRSADFSVVALHAKSGGLSSSTTVTANAQGTLQGAEPSSLAVDLVVNKLIGGDGKVHFDPGMLKGSVTASKLPTSLAQPFLASTAIVLDEDLGPMIDALEIRAPGSANEPISLKLDAKKAKLEGTANVDSAGALSGGALTGTIEATPATLARVGHVDVTAPARLALRGKGLAWSQAAKDASPLSTFVGTIELEPLAALAWKDPANTMAIALGKGGQIAIARAKASDPFEVTAALAVAADVASAPVAPPSAPNLTLKSSLSASLDRIEHTTVRLDVTLSSALVAAKAQQTLTKPLHVIAEVKDFAAPLPMKGFDGFVVDATVSANDENGIFVKEASRDVRFANIVASVKSADLGKGASLALTGAVDRGTVAINESVGPLPKDFAKFDVFALDARGTAKLSGIDGAALMAWVPSQRDVIEAAGIRNLTLDLNNEPLDKHLGQRVVAKLGGDPVSGEVRVSVGKESATVEKLDLTGVVGKQLLVALQPASETPTRLAADAKFALSTAQQVTIIYEDLKAKKLPSGLSAKLSIPEAIVAEAPGLHAPAAIRAFETQLAVDQSGTSATATGSLSAVGTNNAADKVENVTFNVAWKKVEGPSLLKGLSGDVKVSGASVPWIESLLGQANGRFSTWTGDMGGAQLAFGPSKDGESIRLTPALPRVAGTLDVLAKGESVRVTTTGLAVRVDRAKLAELASKPGGDGAASRYDFQGDLVVQISAASARLPHGLAPDGVNYEGASLDFGLETQPLGINVQAPGKPAGRLDVPAIVTKASSKDLANGITFSMKDHGTAPGAGAGPAPVIDISGMLRNLVNARHTLRPADKFVLDLDASVKALPSVFVDLVAATGGKITRSVGETIDFTAKAQNASKQAGQLSLSFTAPFVELKAPSIAFKDGTVSVSPEQPITSSFALSPGVKEDLLYVINPIFADVDVAAQRGTMKLSSLAYPLDGNMANFDGDLRLDIGDLKFKNGQPLSVILGLLSNKPDNLEGRIEPLVVTVRKGILKYDDFAMKIGRTTTGTGAAAKSGWKTVVDMRGEIDLTKKPIYATAITTKLPISQFGNFSGDVRGIIDALGGPDSDAAKALSIGVTMYGPLFDAQGKVKKLEQKIEPPDVKDLAKDPGTLIQQGVNIFDAINKDKNKDKKPSAPAKK